MTVTNNKLVSVVIPNYNYANYVGEAVESVLRQTYNSVEIIVVDDGSTDGSKEVLSSYGGEIKTIFQDNSGVSAARNNGANQSSGKYLAFLDADDIWLPRKIEAQVKLFEENENLGLVHVGVEDIDAEGNAIEINTDGLAGRVSRELLLFERSVILGGGSGFMIRRDLFEKLNGFDLNLLTSADWDIFFRAATESEVGFVPDVLLKYRMHGSNMHGNVKRMEREMLYAFGKAFSDAPQEINAIKSRSYGNLYRVLAGSYFRQGAYLSFLRQSGNSILRSPKNLVYFLKFPIRRLSGNSA